jgi:hypothetical protein
MRERETDRKERKEGRRKEEKRRKEGRKRKRHGEGGRERKERERGEEGRGRGGKWRREEEKKPFILFLERKTKTSEIIQTKPCIVKENRDTDASESEDMQQEFDCNPYRFFQGRV